MAERDQCNEGELAQLDADVEHGQRQRDLGPRHADGGQAAREAEAVKLPEAEGVRAVDPDASSPGEN